MLRRRLGVMDIADQITIAVPDPAHGFVLLELACKNAHRNTGPAVFAGRAVGDVLRAAEAALGQQIIQLARATANEVR